MDRSAGDHRIIGQFGVACALLAIGVGYSDISSRVGAATDAPSTGVGSQERQAVDVDGDALPKGLVARLGTKRYRPTDTARWNIVPYGHAFARDANGERFPRGIGMPTRAGCSAAKGCWIRGGNQFNARRTPPTAAFLRSRDTRGGRTSEAHTLASADRGGTGRVRLNLEFEELGGETLAISSDGRAIAIDTFADGGPSLPCSTRPRSQRPRNVALVGGASGRWLSRPTATQSPLARKMAKSCSGIGGAMRSLARSTFATIHAERPLSFRWRFHPTALSLLLALRPRQT